MGFMEFSVAFVLAIAGGAAGAAVINGINERWKFKASRKAAKEDKAEEKADKTEEISERQNEAAAEALKVILLDRIRHLGQSYIQKGEISFDDRRIFHMMHDAYHDGLGGNGDADLVVEAVDDLPLKP